MSMTALLYRSNYLSYRSPAVIVSVTDSETGRPVAWVNTERVTSVEETVAEWSGFYELQDWFENWSNSEFAWGCKCPINAGQLVELRGLMKELLDDPDMVGVNFPMPDDEDSELFWENVQYTYDRLGELLSEHVESPAYFYEAA